MLRRRFLALIAVMCATNGACYGSVPSGGDAGEDDAVGPGDGEAERASDSSRDAEVDVSSDGVVDGADTAVADEFYRDTWYPDHVPDGVDASQVVVPLPLGFAACEVPASTGKPCVGDFQCCAQSADPSPSDPDGTVCVDTEVSRAACGGCGRLCPYPARCTEGVCVAPAGYTFCGCAWSDLERDAFHCGNCDNACPEGADCIAGRCTAREDSASCVPDVGGTGAEMLCGNGCVGVRQSANCESCGRRCRSFRPGEARWDYCDASMFCGQCQESSLPMQPFPWIVDDVGREADGSVSGSCPVGMIQWLGGECLEECPPEMTLVAYSRPLPDDIVSGRACRPFLWSDSGPGWYWTDVGDRHWPYCGAPGRECRGSGSVCIDGDCRCMDGLTRCEDAGGYWCADLTAESANCGACGHACAAGSVCVGGTCSSSG